MPISYFIHTIDGIVNLWSFLVIKVLLFAIIKKIDEFCFLKMMKCQKNIGCTYLGNWTIKQNKLRFSQFYVLKIESKKL
jgi:hypothetical protein